MEILKLQIVAHDKIVYEINLKIEVLVHGCI